MRPDTRHGGPSQWYCSNLTQKLALALAVEQRDNMTAGHCERLAIIRLALGMSLSLDEASLLALYRGGYLHDIGKVGIADAILLKPGKLTPEEWIIMQGHPARDAEICCHLRSLAPVLPLIRHHHERWDRSGYPDRLRKGDPSAGAHPASRRYLRRAHQYPVLQTGGPCQRGDSHH
jgi:HD-GYP domain-containing protein (c-di-GMP phosphodiesterase class II)